MQTFLFINPASGRFGRRRVSRVLALLDGAGLAVTVCSVTTPVEALSHCQRINAGAENPLVIVAAGDGTINAVVNGLLPGSATLAILPLGTSNVLAAEIGISSVEDGIRRIIAGNTRSLSIGILEMERRSFRFVLMAGIGVDGGVVRDVWPPAKRLLRQGAYGISALANIFGWDHDLVEVATADRTVKCHSVIICNASRYGGNFILSPESNLFSAELTAVCILKNRCRSYLKLAFELLLKKPATSSEIILLPAEAIEIRGTKPIQIDGDFVGYSPARLHTMADFARIIV